MELLNTRPAADQPRNSWLDRLHQVILEKLNSGNLSNNAIALQMCISERHFIRRMKALTGLPPQQYIRRYRLQLARQLLENGTYRTAKAAAVAVGYTNSSYFISQFEKEYGCKPMAVLRQFGWR